MLDTVNELNRRILEAGNNNKIARTIDGKKLLTDVLNKAFDDGLLAIPAEWDGFDVNVTLQSAIKEINIDIEFTK